MQAAFTLARIAKEDAAEAVRLYFEPLFRLLSWLRQRLSGAVENKDRSHLITDVETLEARGRNVEVLEFSAQVNYELQTTRRMRKVPLFLFEETGSERLVHHLSLLAWDSSLLESETRDRTISRIREVLSTDTARLAALSSLLSLDFGQSALSPVVSLRSLLDDLQPVMGGVKVIGFSNLGRTVLLDHSLKTGEPSGERRRLLEGIEQPQVPDIGRQALRRFGIYLEVAAFLAQEGYEEAAVVVVDRAFKLFGPGEMIKPTREAK